LKTKNYDTVIVGAGHNGMIAGTYLAKKGRKVIIIIILVYSHSQGIERLWNNRTLQVKQV
jgi:ribulose 1,5-bisphosphate synthetase/thiazole synthase